MLTGLYDQKNLIVCIKYRMSHCINEITTYFSDADIEISRMSLTDQVTYYKLIAILHGEEVELTDQEIKKIDCIRLLYDYRYKDKLRAIDVLMAGDYPITLIQVLKYSNEKIEDLYKIAIEQNRLSCSEVLKKILN